MVRVRRAIRRREARDDSSDDAWGNAQNLPRRRRRVVALGNDEDLVALIAGIVVDRLQSFRQFYVAHRARKQNAYDSTTRQSLGEYIDIIGDFRALDPMQSLQRIAGGDERLVLVRMERAVKTPMILVVAHHARAGRLEVFHRKTALKPSLQRAAQIGGRDVSPAKQTRAFITEFIQYEAKFAIQSDGLETIQP